MLRRTFFGCGFVLAGLGRRAWAAGFGPPQAGEPPYHRLSKPVRIPLAEVSEPWRPVSFTAETFAPSPAAPNARRYLISGVLFRKEKQDAAAGLSALCLTCPHEQCRVDLITDPSQLAKMSDRRGDDPLFECGCHFSVFDARNDGERLSGEAPRGLFRFRIGRVADGVVEIDEIEESALSMV
jgi:Rieske Fe-S protein